MTVFSLTHKRAVRLNAFWCVLMCWLGVGCSELPPPPIPAPDGYVGVKSWNIEHDARTENIHPEGPSVIQNPVRMIVSHDESSVLVAEEAVWRVRSYPVLHNGEGVVLEKPSLVATIDPDTDEGAHIPASFRPRTINDQFGKLLTRSQDGVVIVSDPQGEPWVVPPGAKQAERLGFGQGARPLRDGARLRESDVSNLRGLAWAPSAESDLEVLWLVTDHAIFSAQRIPSEDGRVQFAPVRHIAGSGAASNTPAQTGDRAREANFTFAPLSLIASDSRHLIFTEVETGILWAIPNVNNPDAVVVRLGGGGSQLSEDAPILEQDLSLEGTNALQLLPPIRTGSTHRLFIFIKGVPRFIHVSLNERDLALSTAEVQLALDFRRRENMSAVFVDGDLLLANRRNGSIERFPTPCEDPSEENTCEPLAVLVAGSPDNLGRARVPRVQRPSAITPYNYEGRATFAVSDAASGTLSTQRRDGALDGVLVATEGRTATADPRTALSYFNPFQAIAHIPNPEASWLLTNSRYSLHMYGLAPVSCGSELCINSVRLASNGTSDDSINLLSLTSYIPDLPPTLFAFSQGTVLLDPENTVAAKLITSELRRASASTTLRSFIQTQDGTLPTPGSNISSIVLNLRNTRDISPIPEPFLITVHADDPNDPLSPARVVATAIDTQDIFQTIAAQEPPNRDASALIAGGGDAPTSDGAQALDVRLHGAHSATITPQGDVLIAVQTTTVSTLLRVDPNGTIQTLTDPNTPTPLSFQSPSPLPIDQFAPPSPFKLYRLPCAPHITLAETSAGLWGLNTLPEPQTIPSTSIRIEPNNAVRLTPEPPERVGCVRGVLSTFSNTTPPTTFHSIQGDTTQLDLSVHSIIEHPEQTLAVGRQTNSEPWQLWDVDFSTTPPTTTSISAQTTSIWEQKSLRNSNIADELPLWSTHRDGSLYAALPNALLHVPTTSGELVQTLSRLTTLWDTVPLDDPDAELQSFAVDTFSSLETPTVYYALDGVLYQHTLDNQQTPVRIAGGGTQRPGPLIEPLNAAFSNIHAIVPGKDGRVWLWWDDTVGYLDPTTQQLTAIAGGGTQSPRDAQFAWDLNLPSSSIHHPPMTRLENGDLLLTDATRGLILRIRPLSP